MGRLASVCAAASVIRESVKRTRWSRSHRVSCAVASPPSAVVTSVKKPPYLRSETYRSQKKLH